MLQQTQVKTVIPYFKNFVKKIPNLKVLSNSKNKKILKLWEGLGYYRRAKNLQMTAKILIKKYNGSLPKKFEEIKKLRSQNLPTIPSSLEEELKSNIFLRCDQNVLKIKLNMKNQEDFKVFKKVRDLKDSF